MVTLKWDEVGSRTFENGIDRGVLYLPDGSAVPWNGLTSVVEKFDKKTNPIYFDGMKVDDVVELGTFTGTMKAVTYPDVFTELEGLGTIRNGVFVADQKPKKFGLCYRTRIGDDFNGEESAYKINVIYNVTAIPAERTHASLTINPTLVEFEWNLTAVPTEVMGYRPSPHLIIDSRNVDPWLLEDLENLLYGSESEDAYLIPMDELVAFFEDWYRIKITDNEDGTWTATAARSGIINFNLTGKIFTIYQVNAVYLTDVIYQLSDTTDIKDLVVIRIIDNGNETWTATSASDALIYPVGPGEVVINEATIEVIDEDTYTISDTLG